MKNFCDSDINKEIEFENLIIESSYESIKKAKDFLNFFHPIWIQKFIQFESNKLPLKYKQLAEILQETGEILIKFDQSSNFSKYLYLKKIISLKNFPCDFKNSINFEINAPIEELESPLHENTLAYFISINDVENFLSFSTLNSINLKTYVIHLNDLYFMPLEYALFCGSIDIVKYFIINGFDISWYTLTKAVEGGSENIIELLSTKEYSFKGMLKNAIEFHQNKIAKWLYENYEDSTFTLPYCVKMFNTEMLIYFINECNRGVNELNQNGQTCLHQSVIIYDTITIKYLINKGINPNIEDNEGKISYYMTQSKEIKNLIPNPSNIFNNNKDTMDFKCIIG